jgi:Uma2 family endonuclease
LGCAAVLCYDAGVNVQAAIGRPEPVKLRVNDFWLLKQSGAFAAYSKSELLEGELWGVPREREDEPDYDSSYPIKLRIADYELLDRGGAFDEYRKTELIDGVVYAMNPQHRRHGFAKDELAYRLRRALEAMRSNLHVATEQSVALEPDSEPQPDIILTTEPRGSGAIPRASVALLVEVSDSSVRFDLADKSRVYATAGISEYWVLDVIAGRIHLMWSPQGDAYAERREVKLGEAIGSAMIEGLIVETAALI